MGSPAESIINLDIVVPNRTRYLRLLGNIAEQIAKQLDTGDGDRDTLAYDLDLALTEAVANAIQYGCPTDAKHFQILNHQEGRCADHYRTPRHLEREGPLAHLAET